MKTDQIIVIIFFVLGIIAATVSAKVGSFLDVLIPWIIYFVSFFGSTKFFETKLSSLFINSFVTFLLVWLLFWILFYNLGW
jgi:hypothetical protein